MSALPLTGLQHKRIFVRIRMPGVFYTEIPLVKPVTLKADSAVGYHIVAFFS